MAILVRMFASFREIAGASSFEYPFRAGLTVGSVLDELRSEGKLPADAQDGTFLCAVNQSYAPTDQVLGDGDEMALIPPVSGG